MQSSRQKAQRKWQRETLKAIEAVLHPDGKNPVINGVEIVHCHQGQKITFTAWKGQDPANNRILKFSRDIPLNDPEFYETHKADIEWLAGGPRPE